jgi:hypothetical protein
MVESSATTIFIVGSQNFEEKKSVLLLSSGNLSGILIWGGGGVSLCENYFPASRARSGAGTQLNGARSLRCSGSPQTIAPQNFIWAVLCLFVTIQT